MKKHWMAACVALAMGAAAPAATAVDLGGEDGVQLADKKKKKRKGKKKGKKRRPAPRFA